MKAAILHDKNNIIVKEIDKPEIERDDQVQVKVHSALLCGADLHLFVGNIKSKYPVIPGYCFSGVIEDAGAGVTNFQVKDRVCGLNFGSFGAFAEYIAISQDKIYKFPADVSFEEAIFIEPVALALKSLKLTKPSSGENILIFGQGILGLVHTQIFKRVGITIFVTDLIPSRLKLAKKLGADHAFNPNECDVLKEISKVTKQGIDVVIEATGNSEIVELLSRFSNKGVKMVLFSVWNSSIEQFKTSEEKTEVHRIFGASEEDCVAALKTVSDDKVDLNSLVSHRVPLKKIEEAYKLALNPSQGRYTSKAIGVVINP